MTRIETKAHLLESSDGNKLHLLEFLPNTKSHHYILLIHGAIENGKIFYSKNGKGLAPFLQKQGFHCFVLDLRGRGLSTPQLSKSSSFGQREMITQDFPIVFDFIQNISRGSKISVITHSWGGVLLNSFLLEFSKYREIVTNIAHFAVKRRVSVFNLQRLFYIDFAWLFLGTIVTKLWGFLPKGFFGPDGESKGTLQDSQNWVYAKKWKDSINVVDYNELAKNHKLPKSIYFTGTHDKCLGHPKDVLTFALESGHSKSDVFVIGKATGYQQDYDHISLLTSRNCKKEHFQQLTKFLST